MPFEKGNDYGNRSGRPKGSPNKTTKEIREAFQMFVEEQQDKFSEWIDRVAEKNPAKAIELVTNLGEYILPKLSRTEVDAKVQDDRIDTTKLTSETLQRLKNELNPEGDTSGDS